MRMIPRTTRMRPVTRRIVPPGGSRPDPDAEL
jgi:hypothetical protein